MFSAPERSENIRPQYTPEDEVWVRYEVPRAVNSLKLYFVLMVLTGFIVVKDEKMNSHIYS